MATEIAKAYVQIIPSALGMKGRINEELGGESESAGKKAGNSIGGNLISTFKSALIAAGIGTIIKEAFTNGADLEQSLGGVETLFKENADNVKRYANQAFSSAGLSANDYMQTVTSFSASLLQGLGGDTQQAAEIAHMAIVDMADNYNKMGSEVESVQNAYQGFAKQNYTMLDNLKLGYGGTKQEMQRLLADAEKLSGVKYDISNLADVYTAIHVIQEEMDITGTTAKEASTTISGSVAAMGASFENVLANLTLGNDMKESLNGLGQSVLAVAQNIVPVIANIITAIPTVIVELVPQLIPVLVSSAQMLIQGLMDGFTEAIPQLQIESMQVPEEVLSAISTGLPLMVESGMEMISGIVNGLLQNLPQIIVTAGNIISQLLSALLAGAPKMLESGLSFVGKIAQGMINNLPAILSAIAQVIAKLLATIVSNMPQLLQKGIELMGKVAAGIIQAIPAVVNAVPKVISGIVKSFVSYNWKEIGTNVISGIANGISSAVGRVAEAAKSAAKRAYEAAKDFLGINSPSRLMKEQIGKFIPAGIAEGINENAKVITFDVVADRITTNAREMMSNQSIPLAFAGAGTIDYDLMGEKMKSALSGTAVQMDGKAVGKITTPTVNRNMASQELLEGRGAE